MLRKKSGKEPSYLPSPSLAGDLLPSKRAIGQHKKILFCLSFFALEKGNRSAQEDLVALEKSNRHKKILLPLKRAIGHHKKILLPSKRAIDHHKKILLPSKRAIGQHKKILLPSKRAIGQHKIKKILFCLSWPHLYNKVNFSLPKEHLLNAFIPFS